MKKIIVAGLAVMLLLPSVSFAQINTNNMDRGQILALIAVLLERIQELQKDVDKMKSTASANEDVKKEETEQKRVDSKEKEKEKLLTRYNEIKISANSCSKDAPTLTLSNGQTRYNCQALLKMLDETVVALRRIDINFVPDSYAREFLERKIKDEVNTKGYYILPDGRVEVGNCIYDSYYGYIKGLPGSSCGG